MSLHLPDIANFIAAHPYWAHLAVFLLAFSEAIPIVGTVVPGSTLVVAISALATAQTEPSQKTPTAGPASRPTRG